MLVEIMLPVCRMQLDLSLRRVHHVCCGSVEDIEHLTFPWFQPLANFELASYVTDQREIKRAAYYLTICAWVYVKVKIVDSESDAKSVVRLYTAGHIECSSFCAGTTTSRAKSSTSRYVF